MQDLLLTVGPILWGMICKYHPAWKRFPNASIPYVTALATLLVKLAEVSTTHNVTTSFAGFGMVSLAGFLAPIVAAGWQAIQNSLIYEVFLRHPLAVTMLRKQ